MDHPPSKNNFEMSVVQKVREEKSDKFPQTSQKKKKSFPEKKASQNEYSQGNNQGSHGNIDKALVSVSE